MKPDRDISLKSFGGCPGDKLSEKMNPVGEGRMPAFHEKTEGINNFLKSFLIVDYDES